MGVLIAAVAMLTASGGFALGGERPRPDATVQARAAAFESFTRQAQRIDAGFADPAAVNSALQVGASYEPKQLSAGMVGYAAMAALQEPRFVSGVRAAGKKPAARRALIRQLLSRPDLSVDLPGAKLAAGRANAALLRRGAALASSGRQVKGASYSVQHSAWARGPTANAAGRLIKVKQIGAAGYRPVGDDAAQLERAVSQGGRSGGGASPAVYRGLAVAALTVLGEGGRAKGLLTEPNSALCLRIAKLNLHQCLASAGPYYEDIYCLGEHAMIEPGQCVIKSAQAKGR